MQNAFPFWLSPLAQVLAAIAIPLASILSALTGYLFGQRKRSADISQSQALTRKTEAEARQIDDQIISSAHKRLDELGQIIHKQNLDKVGYAATIGKLEWQLGLSEQREKIQAESIMLAHAELETLRKPRIP